MIYLDSAATTFLKPRSVERSVVWAMKNCSSVGRGGYKSAEKASEVLYNCRMAASRLFNVSDPERISFTFNATHGLNIAINSLVSKGEKVVVSGYEHNSVMRPLAAKNANVIICGSYDFNCDEILYKFSKSITADTKAVICTHVSNVFGNVLPVYKISEICKKRGVPFVLDASQSAGILEIDAEKLDAAFIAMPGHKGLYGPQGTGILICGDYAKPLLYGGTGSSSSSLAMPEVFPDRLEAGTHNVLGIAGLNAGIEFVTRTGRDRIYDHEKKLILYLKHELERISGVTLYCGDEKHQAGVLSFNIDGINAERVGEILGKKNIAVRTGLHCAPIAHKTAETISTGTVRVSVCAFTKREDIERLITEIKRIVIMSKNHVERP